VTLRAISVLLWSIALTSCAVPSAGPGSGGGVGPGGKADGDSTETELRTWYAIGNALTPGHDVLEGTVEIPEGVARVEVRVDGEVEAVRDVSDLALALRRGLSDLAAGEHELSLAAEGEDAPFFTHVFYRTHPLYIVVSNDWDDTDNTDEQLRRQEELHERHPELILTHFVGPYTFTDPELPEERKRYLAEWVLRMQEEQGDEIGLHIHPYCHFVEAAGVTCRLDPEYASSWRTPGYTVFCSAYEEDEFVELLRTADALFESYGLPKPRTFRAGGWSLELHVLRALARVGYVADTSANNWRRLEEWEGQAGTSLYAWNAMQWAEIDETSQPWWPSEAGMMSTELPVVGVLEVPDNGILVDYVTAAEMVEMFDANWDGGALVEPRQYSIGYHPPSLSAEYAQRMDDALTHIDQHLLSEDAGPVVYARLSDLVAVWPQPM
jgi:predicted deacetylase